MLVTPTVGNYPSIEYVFNLTRINLNDTFKGTTGTPGEGRIFTDDWSPNINVLNEAIQSFQRDVEALGLPTTRQTTQIISSLVFTLTAAANAVAGATTYTGVIPGGALNGMVGRVFNVAGFVNGGNNITGALCTASTATTLTLVNAGGVNEAHAGTATSPGITQIDGPNGPGVADPTIFPWLAFYGWFDGKTLHPSPVLPFDLLTPLKIRTRLSGTQDDFKEAHEFPSGLYSCAQTLLGIGGWNWISDRINMNGTLAIGGVDIELTYTSGISPYPTTLAPAQFATTLIPFLDSADALAYKTAYIYAAPRLPKGGADDLQASYMTAMQGIANRWYPVPPQP